MFELSLAVQVVVLSAILYWLRATIDQHKGAVVEVVAVTSPVALAACLIWLRDSAVNLVELGVQLTPVIAFIFLALPTLAGWRLVERLRLGEQPQLADMFRLTTFISLSTFGLRQLEIDRLAVVVVFLLTVTYLTGDCIVTKVKKSRRLHWLCICAGALTLIYFAVTPLLYVPSRMIDLVMSIEWPVLLGMLLAPALIHILVDAGGRFLWLGYWAVIVRHRFVRPADAIYQRSLFALWQFRPGVTFLNHGSFGAVPLKVQHAQRAWQRQCLDEPMDILARRTAPAWRKARDRLAGWLGTQPMNLALCENATAAMNEIAGWFPLQTGDEVLLTDHEYGAVKRIWERRAARAGAIARYVLLPMPFDDPQRIVESIVAACGPRTRLVVFSHITSPTAVLMPVQRICEELRARGIASCVDGPHALLQERVHLERLGCDFYAASCHKWLCAPLGSGMLYVHPRWEEQVEPLALSWGRLPPDKPQHWTDELTWVGTRDYSPYIAIDAAIDFFSRFNYELLDQRNHQLACYARRVLSDSLGTTALTPESRQWFGWMAAVWLPEGDHAGLQQRLWDRYAIEVPIVPFANRFLVRVSCHLYNSTHDIDRLARALTRELLRSQSKLSR